MAIKTIALLTGRGNNTLRDKNILDILGNPVLYYPANAAKKARSIQNWYCSSDDKKILAEAEAIGYRRIIRPAHLATPQSQHIDCILHALEQMKKECQIPDILVVLLANNVTIKSKWIDACVQKMENNMQITAVVPVYQENDHHPLRAKRLEKDGTLSMYEQGIEGAVSSNRQDLPICYFLAHNFWVINVQNLLNNKEGQPPWTFMGNHIIPYEIEESIDIHKEFDLVTAKNWITSHYDD